MLLNVGRIDLKVGEPRVGNVVQMVHLVHGLAMMKQRMGDSAIEMHLLNGA